MQRHWLIIVAAALLTAGIFMLDRFSLVPSTHVSWLDDWKQAWGATSKTAQDENVTLVLITQDTLKEFPFETPINRRMLAQLIGEIDQFRPRAIVLDIVFDRKTLPEDDAFLAAALGDVATPLVMGVVDARSPELANGAVDFQTAFLATVAAGGAKLSTGHVYIESVDDYFTFHDRVVRRIASGESLAKVAARAAGAESPEGAPLIDWLKPPADDGQDVFLTIPVPAYPASGALADPGAAPRILPPPFSAAFADRVVVIGGDFPNRDRHRIPLSITDEREYAGVTIHAQAIAQILDGRRLYEIDRVVQFAFVLLAAYLGLLAGGVRLRPGAELLFVVAGLAVIVAVDLLLMIHLRTMFPSLAAPVWTVGFAVGQIWSRAVRPLRSL